MDPEDWMLLSGQGGSPEAAGGENESRASGSGPESRKPADLDEWLRREFRNLPQPAPPQLDLADRVVGRLRSSVPSPNWNRPLLVVNVCLGLSCVVAVLIAWPIVNRLTDPWVDLTLTMISR